LEALQGEIDGLEAEVEVLEDRLVNMDEAAAPGERARLEGQRERLLARKERLEWKMELYEERLDAARSALEGLEAGMVEGFRHRPPPRMEEPSGVKEEERVKILQMVADGTITAEDAAKLLEALERRSRAARRAPVGGPRLIRVRVTDLDTGTVRVNVTVPVSLIRAALRGGRWAAASIGIGGLDLDADELEALVTSGVQGHIVDVVDEEDGERVEIIVE
jgi:hypothetical protein